MPPKRNHINHSKNKKQHQNQSKQPVDDAMANCLLPQDIMLSILTRLPVKSLLRFNSVCKPWLELFATPKFIKLHHRQFSDDPENQNFMIYSLSETYCVHTMSLLKIESDEKNPTDLDHPYPEIFFRMDFVGCYNGLICMAFPPLGQGIVLWNPAMRLSKFVRLSKVEFGNPDLVSLGFGYDDEEGDYKVVRIVCSTTGRKMRVGAEVYSAKSDSWKTIKIGGLQFRVVSTKNDAIVGGDPYWVAKDVSRKSQIVWFDVKKMVFKIVPSSNLELGGEGNVEPLMNWKGSLATILCNEIRESEERGSMHVLVFDKDEKIWNMKHIFGPIEMKIYRCLQCSKSGKIVGVRFDGKLFVFDPESGGVKVVEVEEAQMLSFQIYEYSESLACIDGMEPVKVKVKEEEDEEDEVGPGPSVDIAGLFMSYLQLHGGN
ncbi:hypothetical protein C2S53_009223 [Perilla frutescens var. hirtella]|uniref:F-box domain-containing protein n=1 Tax=Perilla frutescens var. hirtella TaxID=608512 RepID=A0AAD4IQN6_PERFH|nr:hypothetical protein C2S53_009223 [Perilla frutescens var. hirtella]